MNRLQTALGLVGWILLCFAAAGIGAYATATAPEFYRALNRPSWAPPAWLFGPVWTILYLLQAISAWMIWKDRGFRGASAALGLFVAQLAVNALWSWLFFTWRLGRISFIEIVILWCMIAANIKLFWGLKPLAGALLLPYIAWVSFATILNFAMWWNNPAVLGGVP
jgi:tryptophan-rich sensory protein